MPTRRFLRPALAVAALPAVALLVGVTASSAPANTAPVAAKSHPVPLQLLHGTKPTGLANTALGHADTAYSSNWSGYVATGTWSGAQFRYVQATFTVPSVNCTTTPGTTADAVYSDWVGLDGVGYNFGSSSTVEQDGIAGGCVAGAPSYYAWWENYPGAENALSLTISPGDAIEADVYYDGSRTVAEGQYNYTLTDVTTGQSFDQWEQCGASSCANSSAEVITEAPSDATSGAVLPLADYGVSNFENIAVTDKAGQRGPLTSSAWYNTEVVMENASDSVLSTPGSLFGGAAFSTFWEGEQ